MKVGDPNKRWAMVIDIRKCVGCSTCVAACKSEFEVPLGYRRNWVITGEKGDYPDVTRIHAHALCNSCDNAPCATFCPISASYRRLDGIIDVNPHMCFGCKICMVSCPYGVRYLHPTRKMVEKCNWCIHLIEKGLDPACVSACPTKAMVFGDIKNPLSEVSQVLAKNPVTVMKEKMGTKPHVFYIGLESDLVEKKKK